MPQNRSKTKKELFILGSPLGEFFRKELLGEKITELEKVSDVIDKLDAHYRFFLLKNCCSMPKLLYFCVRALVFCKKKIRQVSKKFVMQGRYVKMDDNQFSQAVLPAAKVGLGVSSARLLALPAFLASAVGAKDAWNEIFCLERVDETYDDALE